METPSPPEYEFVVLIPVYNDWDAVRALLLLLDGEFSAHDLRVHVMLVNDGSAQPPPPDLVPKNLQSTRGVSMLSLLCNLGHQRALAVGLCYAAEHLSFRAIVVMDGDGEDLASDVPRLTKAFRDAAGEKIVFAQRTRRSEGKLFTFFYHLYRLAHRALTGIRVEIGNFSILPYRAVKRLVVAPNLWNHYAASVIHAQLPVTMIPTTRGKRLSGTSRMNFVSLVSHGLSAMAVFSDRIGARLLVAAGGLIVLLSGGLLVTLAIRLLTDLAIPGWATVSIGFLLILMMQVALLILVFAFMIHAARTRFSVVPAHNHMIFVDYYERLWPPGEHQSGRDG